MSDKIPSFDDFKRMLQEAENNGDNQQTKDNTQKNDSNNTNTNSKNSAVGGGDSSVGGGDSSVGNGVQQIDIAVAVREFISKNKVKILFGTPCYGGLAHTGFMQSMLETVVNLTKLGVEFEVLNIGNESLITRARNGIVAKFMGNPEYTHLMFIDADITFHWSGIIKLLLSDKDLCGGCYPKKNMNWDKIRKNISSEPNMDTKELIARSVDYVFNPVYFKEGDSIIAKVERGMVQVKDVATGFMMIKRNVFDTLKYKYPERQYKNNVAGYHNPQTAENFYTFFDTEIDPQSKVYLSEDYLFCKLWRECGGTLWLDLGINLNHTGLMDYIGCLALTINQVDDLNKDSTVTGNTIS